MVFSSLVFLCIFLPAVLLLHTLVRGRRARNGLLLAASLLFYACGEPVYVLLLLAESLANYGFGLALEKRRSKWLTAAAVVLNIGVLIVFKYAGFLIASVNEAFGAGLPVPQIALPIGISFYTFQALSYVIDVYRGKAQTQKNFARLLLYISFFPQLIAGPIVRYTDIEAQIGERTVTAEGTALGLRRFIAGLGKKVLIANTMGAAANRIFALPASQTGMLLAWVSALAYLMQIYYDFSGYSDMAIGLGRMFGFTFRENFRYPYAADTVQEFWRRWHISLSSWFRDYVYIPLGGNRKGKVRTVFNRILVFALTGLWHGANWTFLAWGLFHGFFLLLEELIPQIKKLPSVLRRLYTLLVVTAGFVIFRADTLPQALLYLQQMFDPGAFSAAMTPALLRELTPFFLAMFAAAVLGCGPIRAYVQKVTDLAEKADLTKKERAVSASSYILAVLLLAWCLLRLSSGSYNPFIYFRF